MIESQFEFVGLENELRFPFRTFFHKGCFLGCFISVQKVFQSCVLCYLAARIKFTSFQRLEIRREVKFRKILRVNLLWKFQFSLYHKRPQLSSKQRLFVSFQSKIHPHNWGIRFLKPHKVNFFNLRNARVSIGFLWERVVSLLRFQITVIQSKQKFWI